MPTITSLTSQKKKDRFNVFLDGKFAFGVDAGTLLKYKMSAHQELSEVEVEEIKKEADFFKTYDKVLHFLSYRPRSESEVKKYLYGKKVDVQRVIDKLYRAKYLDDLEFALWLINQRRNSTKPRGDYRIKKELFEKGIDQKTIAKALAQLASTDESELERAKKAAAKKLKSYDLSTPDGKRKMQQYLLRQGFGWEVVKEVV